MIVIAQKKVGGIIRELENIGANWNRREEKLRQSGLTKKEQQDVHIENRRNVISVSLKLQGGLFTD